MSQQLADKVLNHLEFMGYALEDLEAKEGHMHLATHDDKPTLLVFVSQDLVMLRSRFSGIDARAVKSKDFHESMNTLSANSNITKWFYQDKDEDDEIDLVIEACDFEYEKKSFSKLVDALNAEIRVGLPTLHDFFKD